MNYVKIRCL